jgi:SAM-dependent methyltransferase
MRTNHHKLPTGLNLGCGQFPIEGCLNVDLSPFAKADFTYDLRRLPYPFPDNSFERIEAHHVLEHLEDPFLVMKELHRILKPGGLLRLSVPHFSRGFTHPEHKAGFDVTFPCYFRPDFRGGFTGTTFQLKKMRLHWFCQLPLKKSEMRTPLYFFGRTVGLFLDSLAALSPLACSRLWCFWVGGFEEISFEFQKPN